MRKSLKYSIAIVLTITIAGCGKSFYYTKNTFVDNEDVANYKTRTLFKTDESSRIFIRRLYLDSINENYNEITLDPISNKSKLIEVQYLIFNKDKVLYISTVPSKYVYDKTKQYLLKSPKGEIYYPNCYFLNSFYFGTIKNNTDLNEADTILEFSTKKLVTNWKFKNGATKRHQTLELISIENFKFNKDKNLLFESSIVTNNSVKNKIIFENIYEYNGIDKKYFHYLSFKIPNTKKESILVEKLEDKSKNKDSLVASNYIQKNKRNKEFVEKYESNYPLAKNIYIIYKDANKTKVKELIIPFENKLKNDNDAIKFKSNRVKFITPL